MCVCFRGQCNACRSSACVATFGDYVPKLPTPTPLTGISMRNEVVARAQNFEIIQVIYNGNFVGLEFSQNGRRQQMVDITHMSDVRLKFINDPAQRPSRLP